MRRAFSPGPPHRRCGGPGQSPWSSAKRGYRAPGCCVRWLLLLELLAFFCAGVWGFEVFSEQQIVRLNDPAFPVHFNNTEYGSTWVEEYWAKLDINFSPMEGWSLFKHVRVGCFVVRFDLARESSFVEVSPPDGEEMTEMLCVQSCNRTQTYFRLPECRCAVDEADLQMTEVVPRPICSEDSWHVFRQYDFRSSMSPATYDVARRLLYSIVVVRLPHVEDSVRTYLHAVNAMEAKPKFEYDTLLDRMLFNAIWDFGRSRMVALSIPNWDDNWGLHFTILTFNSSGGVLKHTQEHFPIENQLASNFKGTWVTEKHLASADGLSTIDILWGTYYTVVPANYTYGDGNVANGVHAIMAIDIDTKVVLYAEVLPIKFMNLQINCLTHKLYGTGSYLNGKLSYYELCQARYVNETVGEFQQLIVKVVCDFNETSEMPEEAQYMYLQSAAMDHIYDYAWFTYKKTSTSQPLLMEYHHKENDYELWKEDVFEMDVAYASLIQTAPRIIFVLYPPTLKYAKFNSAGTKILLSFDATTLQGAIPIDTNGDEIPDYFNPEDKVTRVECERFFDDFTMKLIPNSMCQWTSETDIFIEITLDATIVPGDLVRIRPGTVYAGKKTKYGVYQFSQPSTDFAVVELPDEILTPKVAIASNEFIDTCTELVLDGSPSTDHGFRGYFEWGLHSTMPVTSEPHISQVAQILVQQQDDQTTQIVKIPPREMLGDTTYFFSLKVTSFFAPYVPPEWNLTLDDSMLKQVRISALPVPPLKIYGNPTREVEANFEFSITSYTVVQGGCLPEGQPRISYQWFACSSDQVTRRQPEGLLGCPLEPRFDNKSFDVTYDNITGLEKPLGLSGIDSRSLLVQAGTLKLFSTYSFTVRINVTYEGDPKNYWNQATASVTVALPTDLEVRFVGGNGFSTPRNEIIVIDTSRSADDADPNNFLNIGNFSYSCSYTTGEVGADITVCPTIDGGLLSEPAGLAQGGRRLQATVPENASNVSNSSQTLPLVLCQNGTVDGEEWFYFRGRYYKHVPGLTNADLQSRNSPNSYCMTHDGHLILKKSILQLGFYTFTVNRTKTLTNGVESFTRYGTRDCEVKVLMDTDPANRAVPILNLTLDSKFPVNALDVIRLSGSVTNEFNDTQYEYRWTAWKWSANPEYDTDKATTSAPGTYRIPKELYVPVTAEELDFNDWKELRTPVGSRFLAMVPRALSPNVRYKLRLTASDTVLEARGAENTTGYVEMSFTTIGLPPSGGRLESSNLTGIAFDTNFHLSMLGWGTEDLPLTYYFGYKQDPDDPLCEVTFLSATFSDQWEYVTQFPPGLSQPNSRLLALGYARSGIGSTTTVDLMLSVEAWFPGEIRNNKTLPRTMEDSVTGVAPETALLHGIMVAQTVDAGDREFLNKTLDIVEQVTAMRTFGERVEAGPWEIRGDPVALSEQVIAQAATFLTEASNRGLKTNRMIEDIESLLVAAENLFYMDAEETFGDIGVNIALALLYVLDSFFPDDAEESGMTENDAGRRLSDGSWAPGIEDYLPRALQGISRGVEVDIRNNAEKYFQFSWVRDIERKMAGQLVKRLVPGEVPANYYMPGHDFYVGKALTKKDSVAKTHSNITESFDVPSMTEPTFQQMMNVYTYRYIQYKKFPFTFMNLPAGKAIVPPRIKSGRTERKVPDQLYANERLWHAMSLEIANDTGGPLDDIISQSLENASFSMLPKLQAHHLQVMGPANYAATCYRLVEGLNESVEGGTYYDAKGVVFAGQSCITNHLSTFVVLLDDLMLDLDLLEEAATFPRCLFDGYSDCPLDQLTPIMEMRTTAMASSLVITTLMLFGAIAVGWYMDEGARDAYRKNPRGPVQPIDSAHKFHEQPWWTREEPKEKFLHATWYYFRRNHLVVGFGSWHRRLSRERRVVVWYLAFVATKALLTVMHSKMEFRAEDVFIATGIMAGILVFPLMQGVIFLFEWRPDTLVKAPPPTSRPPVPIPLKQQIGDMNKLPAPQPPLAPWLIRPPNFRAPPRVALPPHLTLPVVKPGPPPVPGRGVQRYPPPKRPMLKPAPPPGPPPANHLTASRALGAIADVPVPPLKVPALPGVPNGVDGQLMLAVPELPKLSLQSASQAFGKTPPAPPPKPPSEGPRPPQKPPPLTKMYFTVPKNAMKVPPVPALRAGGTLPGGPLPALPQLPQLMRPPTLSMVKMGGESNIPGPPPPPPPPRARSDDGGPMAPKTPGREDDVELPGGVVGPEWSTSDTPRPPSRAPTSEFGEGLLATLEAPIAEDRILDPEGRHAAAPPPPEDVQADRAPSPALREDPEHAMAPPPPPPPKGPSGGPVFGFSTEYLRGVRVPPPTPPKHAAAVPMFNVPDLPSLPDLPEPGPRFNAPPRVGPDGKPAPPPRAQPVPAGVTLPGQIQFQPPPAPPPPGLPGQADFRNTLSRFTVAGVDGGPPKRGPAIPQLPKTQSMLLRVPNIKQHAPGIVPPPPPPKQRLEESVVSKPVPPARQIEAPPPNVRTIQPFTGAGPLARVKPKPPPKRPQGVILPTPPSGPPPAHALVLKQMVPDGPPPGVTTAPKGLGGKTLHGDVDHDAVGDARKRNIPPPPVPKPPPTASLPSFVHKRVPEVPKAPTAAQEDAKKFLELQQWAPDHVPIKDWVLKMTHYAANFVVAALIGNSLFFIFFFGTYLDNTAVWATHAATAIGLFVNLGMFESLKCLVLASLALVKDETVKRTNETVARRARMALKAQRLQSEGRWARGR